MSGGPRSATLSPGTALWTLRAAMVGLAAAMALAIGGATDGRQGIAGSGAITAWCVFVAVVVVALVVPSPTGLTLVRMLVPVAVPAAVVALVMGADVGWAVAALALALLASFVALSPECAEAFVQASAYGDERRLPLRAPATVLLPMGLSWLAWCAALLAGLLLLLAAQWIAGGLVVIAAVVLGWALARRFHVFARRWLVIVPAGVVVHDSFCLGETLMMMRPNVAQVRLAPADTEAADLTGPAAGHALEITVREMVLAVRAGTRAQPKGSALHVQSLLVAPSRPGRALRALADARVPVG